jgi:8-oxo-dGTP diphosphatase
MNPEGKMPRPKGPSVTADVIILNTKGEILLIKRKYPPFQGMWALPGGFIEYGIETIEECAVREAREETGLKVKLTALLGVRSRPDRDPRGHTVTAVYVTEAVSEDVARTAHADDDASEITWFEATEENLQQIGFAFDHEDIINEAIQNGFIRRYY